MLHEPRHFELRHIVADGGGGKTELVALGERLRADGFAGATVFLNDQAENRALALGERVPRHAAADSDRLLAL